jgi:hypothetical protein
MSVVTMDATEMEFPSECFDLVLDKGLHLLLFALVYDLTKNVQQRWTPFCVAIPDHRGRLLSCMKCDSSIYPFLNLSHCV